MSRVPNAETFLMRFRRISDDYHRHFAPAIDKIREKYADKLEKDPIRSSLEAHVRVYFVNAFLAALNWRLDTSPERNLPNLIPEAPIRSEKKGSIRFLDYLGLERENAHPLLIVEAKSPSALLPHGLNLAATCSEIVSKGLTGKRLKGEWNKWLKDLRDYVRSAFARTGKAPRRAVLTNGEWLILFLDPSNAFLEDETPDPNSILVFRDNKEIEIRFSEIFRHLEHQKVLGETPPLTPGNLLFCISSDGVNRAMHGLRLKYIELPKIYAEPAPIVTLAPVVFLRSNYGAWLRIEAPPREYELPHRSENLAQHFEEVQQAARALLSDVNRQLGNLLSPYPLPEHFEDADGFAACPGMVELGRDEFLVLTGDKTHYILREPSVPACPYHGWDECKRAGAPFDRGPILARSTSPRSFFVSAEPHHCAHRDVCSAKANPISAANRDRCGSRSGQEGQAFCEIWRVEQYLCCRSCVFEEVCTGTTIFRLPCSRPQIQAAAAI